MVRGWGLFASSEWGSSYSYSLALAWLSRTTALARSKCITCRPKCTRCRSYADQSARHAIRISFKEHKNKETHPLLGSSRTNGLMSPGRYFLPFPGLNWRWDAGGPWCYLVATALMVCYRFLVIDICQTRRCKHTVFQPENLLNTIDRRISDR